MMVNKNYDMKVCIMKNNKQIKLALYLQSVLWFCTGLVIFLFFPLLLKIYSQFLRPEYGKCIVGKIITYPIDWYSLLAFLLCAVFLKLSFQAKEHSIRYINYSLIVWFIYMSFFFVAIIEPMIWARFS